MITEERPAAAPAEPSASAGPAESQCPRRHRWTREEYYALAEAPGFDELRVELIGGEVVDMSPINSPHRTSVLLTRDVLAQAFGGRFFVQTGNPISIGSNSDPQPDVAVIEGGVRDYASTHPTTAALVVEVAESTIQSDRTHMASLYASAGIPEYWIVNLRSRKLEVYRSPEEDADQRFGFRYASSASLPEGESVSPLALPEARIPVADLLP